MSQLSSGQDAGLLVKQLAPCCQLSESAVSEQRTLQAYGEPSRAPLREFAHCAGDTCKGSTWVLCSWCSSLAVLGL